jgi:hypothetical protein
MTHEILLEALNTIELPPEDLDDLASEIAEAVPEASVLVGYEDEEGSGVSLDYAIHIFLPSAEFIKDAIYTQIGNLIFLFFKRHRQRAHQGQRNHNLVVHDADGTTLEILSLRPGADEPVRFPPSDDFKRPKPSKRQEPKSHKKTDKKP